MEGAPEREGLDEWEDDSHTAFSCNFRSWGRRSTSACGTVMLLYYTTCAEPNNTKPSNNTNIATILNDSLPSNNTQQYPTFQQYQTISNPSNDTQQMIPNPPLITNDTPMTRSNTQPSNNHASKLLFVWPFVTIYVHWKSPFWETKDVPPTSALIYLIFTLEENAKCIHTEMQCDNKK